MPNALNISITAADRATKVLQDLNKRVDRLTRPFQNVQRSLQGFARAAGFETVKKKLQALTQTARGVVSTFARIGAPLLALVGGGTIAGLLALTDGWARFGLQMQQTARILGVNTQEFYDFRNASQLLGVSGQEATQTFASFSDVLQDARWGRNQQAMGLLIGLGIQLKKTQSGSIDAMDALGQVADKIHAFQQAGNTGAARTLASQLGLTSLLPVLMQGRAALEDYESQARKLTGVMDWKQAADAGMEWNRLHVSMEGVKNSIASGLLPTITPLITQFGQWITQNRALIATDIGDFIKGLGQAFKGITLKDVLDDILAIIRGLLSLGRGIAHVTGELGGVKTVLEVLVGLWGVSKIVTFGMAFVRMATWINGARKALVAWRLARVALKAGEIAEGGAAAGGEAAAGAAGGGTAAAAAGETAAAAGGTGLAAAGGTTALGLLGASGVGLLGAAVVYGGAKLWEHHELAKLQKSRIVAAPVAPSVMQYFERQGWTPAQAAGITANIQAESGFNPNAVGDHGAARGVGQWHADRQNQFNAWAAKNKLPDLEHAELPEQLQYYDYELRNSDAGKKLAGAKTAFDAGSIVSLYDERPANATEEAGRRGAMAESLAPTPAAAPINVSVRTTVQKDGATTTTVQTPAGVKIVHTNPADSVS